MERDDRCRQALTSDSQMVGTNQGHIACSWDVEEAVVVARVVQTRARNVQPRRRSVYHFDAFGDDFISELKPDIGWANIVSDSLNCGVESVEATFERERRAFLDNAVACHI